MKLNGILWTCHNFLTSYKNCKQLDLICWAVSSFLYKKNYVCIENHFKFEVSIEFSSFYLFSKELQINFQKLLDRFPQIQTSKVCQKHLREKHSIVQIDSFLRHFINWLQLNYMADHNTCISTNKLNVSCKNRIKTSRVVTEKQLKARL